MSNCYLLKMLFVVSDRRTKEEIHSEIVGFAFYHQNLNYQQLNERIYSAEKVLVNYPIRCRKPEFLANRAIYRSKRQKLLYNNLINKFDAIKTKGGLLKCEAVILETIIGTDPQIRQELRTLACDLKNILWQGEFINK